MSKANEVTSPSEQSERVKRLVMRYRKKVEQNSSKFDGKEQDFTFHGGFTSGYDVGKLSALEDMADLFGIEIDA